MAYSQTEIREYPGNSVKVSELYGDGSAKDAIFATANRSPNGSRGIRSAKRRSSVLAKTSP